MSALDWAAAEGISRTMPAPTWDILICSIVHRTAMLTDLLGELKRQRKRGVGVIVCRDNLELQYGDKCQRLVDASSADYVCFLDDDDWIAPDYVSSIVKALAQRPDYVGFNVRYTEDGEPQVPVEHTLRNDRWINHPDRLLRDIVHFNPIRRELALRSRWGGGGGADIHWADGLRNLGCVKTEVYIERELHYYRKTGRTFSVPAPMLTDIPPQPDSKLARWI